MVSSFEKRLEKLEAAAGLGRYTSGFCRCPGPVLFKVDWSAIDGREPEPVGPEFCSECGAPKGICTLAVVYENNSVDEAKLRKQELISDDNL
jgi:hypothetical protein